MKVRGTWQTIARVAPESPGTPENGWFIVEWLLPPGRKLREEVARSLEFILIEKQDPKPWAYLCYHCSTASNLYSRESGGPCYEWIVPKTHC